MSVKIIKGVVNFIIYTCFVLLFLISVKAVYEKSKLPFELNSDLKTEIEIETGKVKIPSDYTLIYFNGQKVANQYVLENLCDHLPAGSVANLTFGFHGKELSTQVKLGNFYNFDYIVIWTFTFAVFMFAAAYVYIKKKGDKISTVFFWLALSSSGVIGFNNGMLTFVPALDLPLIIGKQASQTLLGISFLHFTFIFPNVTIRKYKWILYPFFAAGTVLTVYISHLYCVSYYNNDLNLYTIYSYGVNYFIQLGSSALIIIGLFFLLYNYRSNRDEIQRRKLRWIFFGISFATLNYIVLYQIPAIILQIHHIDEAAMLLGTTIAPITFFISIIRYRILDIDFIINRTAVYVFILIILTVLWYIVFKILTPHISFIDGVYFLIGAILFAVTFEKLKNKFQVYIDKIFFRIKYSSNTSKEFFRENLKDCISAQEVTVLLVTTLNKILPVESIGLVELNHKNNDIVVLQGNNNGLSLEDLGVLREINYNFRQIQFFSKPNSLEEGIASDELDESVYSALKVSVVVVGYLPVSDFSLVLLLGSKKTRFQFTREDEDLIKMTVINSVQAIQRIILQNELMLKQEEAKKLKEISDMKSYFVSSVSHELKTPITSIRMFAELMKTKEIERSKSISYLEIVESECDRLNRLINNVLNFSKMEKGMKQYHFTEFNAAEKIGSALEIFSKQPNLYNLDLSFKYDDPDTIIYADPDAFTESIINLVSNAIKYSGKDKVITVEMTNSDDSIKVSINDNGFGINQDDLQHIFDAFYRSKNEKQLHSGGTGLGLAIVKEITEANNGSISVESQPGVGSKFILNFPKVRSHEKNIDH